ncbi:acyl-CoA thioesterase [Dyella choica]|uniref:Acyl-CoA thioesterase n=1 Tax=Dyella choica TaxID=1927959 RepID=A0A3S0WYP4_9GAMM|nr:thioesterase family protein [Dyella choica]RUL79850.1 acyl-CoA thioesterase [Dyella choica]
MTTAPDTPAAQSPLLYTAPISVRWRDLDAFNHVNNSTYLTYLEEARVQWLQRLPGPWSDEHAMPVMAASELNYRLPIEWPGEVHVQLYCTRLGNSSMTVGHRIVDAADHNKLYCDGHVVMVWMDPATGKSVPLPQALREAASQAA